MTLTGLEIFKLLPKTNCGDCGVPTCLAFAMQLAQKKAELSACPHASEEAKSVLGAASEPPMRTIKIGTGPFAFEIGGETEMFRHQKTFYHQTALFVQINDTDELHDIQNKVKYVDEFEVERVGEKLRLDGFCLSNMSGDKDKYLNMIEVVRNNSSKAVLLDCEDAEILTSALEKLDSRRPVIYSRDSNANELVALAAEKGASLVLSADKYDELADLSDKIGDNGLKELILNLRSSDAGGKIQNNTVLRRSALRKNFKSYGYPSIWFIEDKDEIEVLADAVLGICKYSGIIVLPKFNKEMLLSLFTLRQNIYTDPQKPIQVDPKLAAIGEPGPDSPVFVTTNFSLTYFIISGEIENAGISAWLVIPECEGMSVLTAWAAGKFSGDQIGKFVREIGLEEKVNTREIIIPGYVATISGDLEEALPGWKVTVGPQEAADIASFVNTRLKAQ